MEVLRSRAGHARSSETTFGTDKVAISLDSRAPGLAEATRARTYDRLHDIVKEVDSARVLVGFHFRNSDLQGSNSDARSATTSAATTSSHSAEVP